MKIRQNPWLRIASVIFALGLACIYSAEKLGFISLLAKDLLFPAFFLPAICLGAAGTSLSIDELLVRYGFSKIHVSDITKVSFEPGDRFISIHTRKNRYRLIGWFYHHDDWRNFIAFLRNTP